jgi:ribosomal protein S18 acetylase RimI-like enzyme
VAYLQADPIGYFELSLEAANSVEITYFGLLPNFIVRGYGGTLLSDAINRAFLLGGDRVWLHTCTLDHSSALQNYRSRDFKVFREESFTIQLPAEPLQSCQGAKAP